MNLIEEIIEAEKHSDHLIQKAREKAYSDTVKAEESKKAKLSKLIHQLKEKQTMDLEKQSEELNAEKERLLKNLDKELDNLKQGTSLKKKEAVDFILSQIL